WLHLGDAGAIGLADARTLAAEAMLAVARGNDPAADKRVERGAGTFADLAARYVELCAKKNNKSWKQADALVRRYVVPRWGKLQAASHPRRCAHHDGPHRGTHPGQPGLGGGLGHLLMGGEAGVAREQPVPRRRPQRDARPRARAVRQRGAAVLERVR